MAGLGIDWDKELAAPAPQQSGLGIDWGKEMGSAQPAVKQNKGAIGDLGTSLKRGFEELPGTITGLADLPSAIGPQAAIARSLGASKEVQDFVARPVTRTAEWLGEKTGFQPGKWADQAQAQYSEGHKASQGAIDTAWKDPSRNGWDVAAEYAKNPMYTANQVVESLPGMVAGGIGSKALMGVGKVSAALPGALERVAGKWAAPIAAGVGEGAVTTGQQMDQYTGDDQQRNAMAALGAGALTGAIGVGAGRLANTMGLETAETLMAKGMKPLGEAAEQGMGRTARMAGGALSEGMLQEFPQSMQEQMWQNYADGKPIMEGVLRQGVEGALAGGVMGAGANIRGGASTAETGVPDELQPQDLIGLPAPGRTVSAGTSSGDILQGESSRENAFGVNEAYAEYVNAQRGAEEQRRNSAWEHYGDEYTNIDVMGNRTAPAPSGDGSQAIAIPTQGAGAAPHAGHFEHPIVRAVSIITQAARAAQHGTQVEGQFAEDLVWADAALRAEVGEEGYNSIVSRAAAEAAQAPKPKGKTAPGATAQPTAPAESPLYAEMGVKPNKKNAAIIARAEAVRAADPQADLSAVGMSLNKYKYGAAAKELDALETAQSAKAATDLSAEPSVSIPTLAPVQQKVLDTLRQAQRSNVLDSYVDAKGTIQYEKIANDLNLQRGSVLKAIQGMRKAISAASGMDVRQYLETQAKDSRVTEMPDTARLGLSPEHQLSQVDTSALFGNPEAGADPSMGEISSIGGSQSETSSASDAVAEQQARKAVEQYPPMMRTALSERLQELGADYNMMFPEERLHLLQVGKDRDITAEDVTEARRLRQVMRGEDTAETTYQTAQEAESQDMAEAKRVAEAQANAHQAALFNAQVLATNDARVAAIDWNDAKTDGAPTFAELTDAAQASFVLEYHDHIQLISESTDSIEAFIRGFEKTLEPSDVRQSGTTDQEVQPGSDSGVRSLGSEGQAVPDEVAPAPVQAKQPTVVTKKRRIAAQPDDGQISEIDVKHSVAPAKNTLGSTLQEQIRYASDHTGIPVDEIEVAVNQALMWEELYGDHDATPNPYEGMSTRERMTEAIYELADEYGAGDKLPAREKQVTDLADLAGVDPLLGVEWRYEAPSSFRDGELTAAIYGDPDVEPVASVRIIEDYERDRVLVYREVTAEDNREVEVVPFKKLREARDFAADFLAGHKLKHSVGTNTQGQTVAALTAKLLKAFSSPYFFNRAVGVVQTDDALPEGLQSSDDVVQAVYDPKTNKVWMVAGNIAEGQELAVLLHEVGVHMGMKNLLGLENYVRLLKQVQQWAETGTGQEGEIARRALARVKNAEAKVGTQAEDELLAYFVEEAVNAGVDPTALKSISTPLAKFLATIMRAVNAALAKFGIRAEALTAQNVVDLAYGAAHLEFTAAESAPSQDARKFSVASDVKQSFNEFKQSGLMTSLGDLWGKTKPALLTAHQMVDQYGGKLKGLVERALTIGSMEKMQNDIVQAVHKVAMQWQAVPNSKRNNHLRDRLHQVMMDATMWQIHPDQEFMKGGNAHLKASDQANYDDLKTRFDALGEAKGVYTAARDVLADNWAMRSKVFDEVTMGAYEKRIAEAATPKDADKLTAERDKLIKEHTEQIKSMKGPYFPLMRFGSYLSISMSKKLAGLVAQQADAQGEAHAALTKEINELKKQGAHYVVEAFDSKADAQKASNQRIARGMESYPQLAEQHFAHNRSIQNVAQLTHAMTHGMEPAEAAKVKEKIAYLYIAGMPEHAALQRQLKRVGVEGATTDMLRAFAEAGKTDSFFLSRMKYAGEMTDQLFRIKRDAKASRDLNLQHVARVLEKHVELDMTYDDSPFQNAVNRISGIWHLAMSPAYLLTNASQPWFITAPMMAGKFNSVPKTLMALWRGWSEAKAAIILSKKAGGWMADFDITQLPTDVQDVVRHVADNGQLAINQLADMGLLSGDTNPRLAKAQQAINMPNSVIELSNRLTTTIAAYRLALAHGMTDEKAKAYALQTVVDTQLDYTGSNTALAMRQNGLIKHAPVKMMMQFRKYQQGMVYLVAELAHKSFAGDKEALRSLGYLFTMQGAFAGAAGIPLVMTPLAILSLFAGGGDDEEGDLETQLRNYLTDTFGADTARAMWKGLPAAMGLDISKRVGMGSLFDPLPFVRLHDVDTAKTGQDATGKILTAVLGAGVGTGASMLDSTKMFGQGDFAKGFEKLLPKALADLVKMGRYATEGMTTRRGDEVIPAEQFGVADLALRAAGFTPTMETEHYEAQQSKEDVKAAIKQRREATIRDMVDARKAGDHAAALDAMREFNEAHPSKEFRVTIATAIKSEQAKRKVKRDEAGIAWTKNERALRDITRYAGS